jgi:alpha-beta hydrolase superfamily lysophospholipase
MGGAIGMTYLEQNPNDFNAAAFSSPMLGLTYLLE